MKRLLILLGFLALWGCVPAQPGREPFLDDYKKAFAPYMARMDLASEVMGCVERKLKELRHDPTKKIDTADCPKIPDIRKGETISEYGERVADEWAERDCSYQGVFAAREGRNPESAKRECLELLELKRIRRELEKLREQRR